MNKHSFMHVQNIYNNENYRQYLNQIIQHNPRGKSSVLNLISSKISIKSTRGKMWRRLFSYSSAVLSLIVFFTHLKLSDFEPCIVDIVTPWVNSVIAVIVMVSKLQYFLTELKFSKLLFDIRLPVMFTKSLFFILSEQCQFHFLYFLNY